MAGVGYTLPGYRQRAPPGHQHTRQQNPHPVLFEEQRNRKAAKRSTVRLSSHRSSLSQLCHSIQPPFRHLEEALACLQLPG